MRAKLDAAGISVCMFGSPIGKIDVTDDLEIDLEKLRHLGKLIPVFLALDASVILTPPGMFHS